MEDASEILAIYPLIWQYEHGREPKSPSLHIEPPSRGLCPDHYLILRLRPNPAFQSGDKGPLRINPEQTPVFRPKSRRVDFTDAVGIALDWLLHLFAIEVCFRNRRFPIGDEIIMSVR